MNLLIVGGDTKGAWHMRGKQLGRALGARVTSEPQDADWAWADLVVLVKRSAVVWADQARALTVPVVWDVLDFWQQPEDNGLSKDAVIAQVKQIQSACGASLLIGATMAMAADIGGVYLPHHCRLGLTPQPVRPVAKVVGYDGQKKFLGRWLTAIECACRTLGLQTVVNPTRLEDVDVLVSLRDGKHDGWVCRQWKSGVKQGNAIVAGRPILSQPSAAQDELRPVGATIESFDHVEGALRHLCQPDIRDQAYRMALHRHETFSVAFVARRYQEILGHARKAVA